MNLQSNVGFHSRRYGGMETQAVGDQIKMYRIIQSNFVKFIVIIISVFVFPQNLLGGNITEETVNRIIRATAIKIDLIGKSGTATGHILKIPQYNQYRLLVTNLHVVKGQDSIQLTIPRLNNDAHILDTILVNFPLYNDKGDSLFITGDFPADLAYMLLPISKLFRTKMDVVASLDTVFYLSLNELELGSDIVYFGFPFGIRINRFEPLSRFGKISGIDSLQSKIYIEADVFGGSSGSPVFLDLAQKRNADYYNKTARIFVGIIEQYIQVLQVVPNNQTGALDSIRGENIGIAKVISADRIKEYFKNAIEVLAPKLDE